MSATTANISSIKDNKYRAALRKQIESNGLPVPSPSQCYEIGLLALFKYSLLMVRHDPEIAAVAEFYAKTKFDNEQ